MKFQSSGEKIKDIRNKLGIKQKELESIGVSRNYISMVESDKRKPSKATFDKIIEFFESRALESHVTLSIDSDRIMMSRKEEAWNYCNSRFKVTNSTFELQELVDIAVEYELYDILPSIYVALGNAFYTSGDFSRAFIQYSSALELHSHIDSKSNNSLIYNCLGKCKLQTADYDEALGYLIKAYLSLSDNINNNSSDLQRIDFENCMYNMALAYKNTGNWDKALESIVQLKKNCSPKENLRKFIDITILEANCYLEKDNTEKALNIYSDTLNTYGPLLGVNKSFLYNNIGLIYLNNDEPKEAITYFDKTISLRSNQQDILSHSIIYKAEAYIKLNDFNSAIDLLNLGITLAKKHNDTGFIVKGHKYLLDIYNRMKDTSKLEAVYNNAITLLRDHNSRESLDFHVKLALLHLSTKNYDKCRTVLEGIAIK